MGWSGLVVGGPRASGRGRGKKAAWAGPCGEGRAEGGDAVGRAARGEKGEKKKKGRWAGPREKEREREKGMQFKCF
jgi:hypothetical protein